MSWHEIPTQCFFCGSESVPLHVTLTILVMAVVEFAGGVFFGWVYGKTDGGS